jgi:hypothetical protein
MVQKAERASAMNAWEKGKVDGLVKSPSAALRLSASRLRSKAPTCLLCCAAFGRKTKPPASQVTVYASFVIARYEYGAGRKAQGG